MSYEMRDCEAIYRSKKKHIKQPNKKSIKIIEGEVEYLISSMFTQVPKSRNNVSKIMFFKI